MNGTEAYRRLHPKTNYDSCRVGASKLLTTANIKAAISKRLDELAMPKSEVLARLSGMARASTFKFIRITDEGFCYFDFSDPEAEEYFYLIKKIKTKRTRRLEGKGKDAEPWEDEWVEVELHDSQAALEKIGSYHKLFEPKEELVKENSGYFTIPAELLAPDFLNSHRAVLSGLYDEFLEDGGRGSTKSTFFGYEIIALIKNNPMMHALAMRQVANTLRTSVFDQINWCINQLGLSSEFKSSVSPLQITYLPTGQKIYFSGNDDPMSVKSIKPKFGYIGILWLEEVDQFKGQEAVRTVEQSIRGGEKIYKFKGWNTPKSENNWINKYLAIPNPKQWRHHSTYLTVPHEWLGRPWLDAAEHLKEVNPKAYEHEYMGVATGSGGKIFDNLDLKPITDEEIKGKKDGNGRMVGGFDHIYYGLDWGYALDPLHWVKCHYDAGKEIIYVFDEFRAHKMKNKPLYDELIKKDMTKRDLLIADSAEPKSIADLITYGLNVIGTEKGEGSVRYGLHWLETRAKIIVDPTRCPFLAEEMLNYEFEQTKDGMYISEYPDKNNHGIDALRYALNNVWRKRGQ